MRKESRAGKNAGFTLEEALELMAPSVEKLAANATKRGYFGLTESDREDIAQECYLAIAKAFPKYDPSRGALRPFLYTAASNALRSIYKARHARGVNNPHLSISPGGSEHEPGAISEDVLAQRTQEEKPSRAGFEEVAYTEYFAMGAQLGDETARKAWALILSGQADSVVTLSKALGMPRTSFNRKVLPALRRFMEDMGLAGRHGQALGGREY